MQSNLNLIFIYRMLMKMQMALNGMLNVDVGRRQRENLKMKKTRVVV